MRNALLVSLLLHLLALLAALGHALARPGQLPQAPSLTAVSITGAATPAQSPVGEASELPRPARPAATAMPKPDAPGPEAEPVPEPEPEAEPHAPAPEDVLPAPAPPTRNSPLVRRAPDAERQAPEAPAEESPAVAEAPPAAQAKNPIADQPPALLEVQWPRRLRRDFVGRVAARVEIDAGGRARNVELVAGTGRKDWDEGIVNALKSATYRAATSEGRAVASSHLFRIEFAAE